VVERVVGKMGSSVLVKVRHARHDGRFLLKYLAPEACSEPFAVERFLQTARMAAGLRSEYTARTLDAGCLERGVPYLVTESYQGTELREIVRVRGALGQAEAVDLVLQAAHAVSEAHRHGVAHGSLSLSTLFMTLGPDGRPMAKVLDFGSAATLRRDPFWIRLRRWTEGTAIFSESIRLWDTLACTAPERLRGSLEATVEGDIWALGTILYELLLGAAPFTAANTPALMAAIAADRAPSARQLGKKLPHGLEQIVTRCLAKSPEGRFESVCDFAQALRRFASPEGRELVRRIEHIQDYDPERSPWFAKLHSAAAAHEPWPVAARRRSHPFATSLILAAIGALAGVTLGTVVVRTLAAHNARPSVIHQR
jgi:serine/threonine protein kinase